MASIRKQAGRSPGIVSKLIIFGLGGLLLATTACSSRESRAAAAAAEGKALFAAGDFAGAGRQFSAAVSLQDEDPAIWIAKGRNDVAQKNLGAAFASYAAALELDSANREALDAVAQLSLASGDLDKAMRTSEQILALAPADPSGLFVRTAVLIKDGRLDAASDTVETGLKSNPTDQSLLILRSRILLKRGEFARAQEVLPPLAVVDRPSALLLQQYADVYERRFNGRGLADVAERASRAEKPSFELLLALGSRRAAINDIDGALGAFTKALQTTKAEQAQQTVALAMAHADLSPDDLVRVLNEALRDARLRGAAAQYLIAVNRSDLAWIVIGAVGGNAGDAPVDVGLAAYIAATRGNWSDARALAQRQLSTDARDHWALLARALAIAHAGKLDGAIRDARVAVSDVPDSVEATRQLAFIYRLQGDYLLADNAIVTAFNAERDSELLLRLLVHNLAKRGRNAELGSLLRRFVLRNPSSVMGWRLRAQSCASASQVDCARRAAAVVRSLRGQVVEVPPAPPDEILGERDYR